ncbi:hypothetical protein CDL12_25044 [Handroanthus impetiginosus]|uniref:Uncharacterized protein n=1 Tax=Handroanthus impetiginosus TaxID=429701 RepID=A0A2G9GAV7_9LAMI|nr:hypothetical protein CDL12_25044 [Handroanthus impetiginosus]
MRPMFQAPTPAAAAGGLGFGGWNSPVPYLFSGFAVMLGLIAVALILLACSYKQGPSYNQSSSEEKSEKRVHVLQPEMEPRVAVIMAGETIPTHLAKPAAVTQRCEEV